LESYFPDLQHTAQTFASARQSAWKACLTVNVLLAINIIKMYKCTAPSIGFAVNVHVVDLDQGR